MTKKLVILTFATILLLASLSVFFVELVTLENPSLICATKPWVFPAIHLEMYFKVLKDRKSPDLECSCNLVQIEIVYGGLVLVSLEDFMREKLKAQINDDSLAKLSIIPDSNAKHTYHKSLIIALYWHFINPNCAITRKLFADPFDGCPSLTKAEFDDVQYQANVVIRNNIRLRSIRNGEMDILISHLKNHIIRSATVNGLFPITYLESQVLSLAVNYLPWDLMGVWIRLWACDVGINIRLITIDEKKKMLVSEMGNRIYTEVVLLDFQGRYQAMTQINGTNV